MTCGSRHPRNHDNNVVIGGIRSVLMVCALFLGITAPTCAEKRDVSSPGQTGDFPRGRPVVLLHGLGLNASSMKKIREALKDDGYAVCAINYPSRDFPIDTLIRKFIVPNIRSCFPKDTASIHFVTHSMGGILVRALSRAPEASDIRIGRVVMIAPPNQGSEVVDNMKDSWFFGGILDAWGGAAGHELGTDTNSVPNKLNRLGPPAFAFGVIAANKSLAPLFSEWIAGRDDGKVAVENTKLEGMKDFIEVPASHTMVLWKKETVKQVRMFLKSERFTHKPE